MLLSTRLLHISRAHFMLSLAISRCVHAYCLTWNINKQAAESYAYVAPTVPSSSLLVFDGMCVCERASLRVLAHSFSLPWTSSVRYVIVSVESFHPRRVEAVPRARMDLKSWSLQRWYIKKKTPWLCMKDLIRYMFFFFSNFFLCMCAPACVLRNVSLEVVLGLRARAHTRDYARCFCSLISMSKTQSDHKEKITACTHCTLPRFTGRGYSK